MDNYNKHDRMKSVIDKLQKTSFSEMPAYEHPKLKRYGGLLFHSLNLWMKLEELTQQVNLHWDHPSSPFVIAMLHHACNIGEYYYNWDYHCWESDRKHTGHGKRSLQVAEELGIQLTEEEKACILYHEGEYSPDGIMNGNYIDAATRYPNILQVRLAVMLLEKEYAETRPTTEVDYAG